MWVWLQPFWVRGNGSAAIYGSCLSIITPNNAATKFYLPHDIIFAIYLDPLLFKLAALNMLVNRSCIQWTLVYL